VIINIAVAGGRKLLREGLSLLLDQQPDLKVIAESADVSTVPKLVRALPVHVAVLNDSVGTNVAAEQVRAVLRANDAVHVVVLAMNPPVQWVRNVLDAGATACLTKECEGAELVSAIRMAHEGQLYLSPGLVHSLVTSQVQHKSKNAVFKSLAPREREILRRIAEGQVTKEIAAELGVGVKTVETHRRRIMAKLNAFTVAELTKHAIRQGLTTLETPA